MKTAAGIAALVLLVSAPLTADEFDPGSFEFTGEMSSLLYWRNDSDFGSTSPVYDENGQSVGLASTFFKPQLAYCPSGGLRLFYEGELGLNLWSRNDPDQGNPAAGDYPLYKHREFYADVLAGPVKLRTGYQRLRDPSDLFLSHWMGAASASLPN